MKKLIISIGAAIFAAVSALAYTKKIGDQTWTYYLEDGGGAAVFSVQRDDGNPISGEIAIPEKLDAYFVTAIGEEVFEGCDQLRRVTIPDCVKKIGATAFKGCTALTSVTIPAGVTEVGERAFAGCKGLKSATIPQCVCDDGLWFAFDADNITKVVIADGATAVGDYAFEGCYNLTLVTIPNTVQLIGDHAFEACYALKRVTIPEGVEEIGAAAFMDCFDLESVTLPSSVTSIGANAFAGCISLTGMTLPDGLRSIGAAAFEDCCGLSRLTLPTQLEIIGGAAFRNSGLTGASIPNSVTNVGAGAFAGCAALSTVTIAQNVFDLGVSNVFGKDFAADIVIAEGVERIPDRAFERFSKIRSVTLPESVLEIGESAFEYCWSLVSVNFPDAVTRPGYGGELCGGVRRIGPYAFYGCWSLAAAELPPCLEEIGEQAFWECNALKSVALPSCVFDCQYSGPGAWNGEWRNDLELYGLDAVFGSRNDPEYPRLWESVTVLNDENGHESFFEEVPPNAFEGLRNLRTVTLPSSVRTIGSFAFSGCAKLESVMIAGGSKWDGDLWEYYNESAGREIGDYAFQGCASLTRVGIPDGVTRINSFAFADCARLAAVVLPESVQLIGVGAFENCRSLASVNFPDAVTQGQSGELVGGVRSVGRHAFYGCSSLASAKLPPCLEVIGEQAFWECNALRVVTLPSCVFDCEWTYETYDTSIWDWRRETLYGLDVVFGSDHPCRWESVTVLDGMWDEGMTEVPSNAFGDFQNLRTVTLPSSVRSIGENAFKNCLRLQSVTIAGGSTWDGDLREYYEDDGSRMVGDRAFQGCASLTRVDIPDGVTCIGDYAFGDCAKLVDVALPESVTLIEDYAFYGCASLTHMDFPEGAWDPGSNEYHGGIRYIGSFAFANCTSLTSVRISDEAERHGSGTLYVGDRAFANCYALKDVTLLGHVVESGFNSVFYLEDPDRHPRALENVTLLGWMEEVPDNAFDGFWNLRTVTLPATVRRIGDYAFEYCAMLESVTIAAGEAWDEYTGAREVGTRAFAGCANLVRVDIPDRVTKIGDYAFEDCAKLVDVTLPESVEDIGVSAFYGCASLTSMDLPEGVWDPISGEYFGGVRKIGMEAFANCVNLTYVRISDEVERRGLTQIEVGDMAFANCYALKDVTLPGHVVEDGFSAVFYLEDPDRHPRALENVTVGCGVQSVNGFGNCPNLRTVTLPTTVRSIGENAFKGCAKLESVTISGETDWWNSDPFDWASVGSSAFEGCVNLVRVDIPACVNEIGSRAFYGCSSLAGVMLPEGAVAANGNLIRRGLRQIMDQAFFGCSSLVSVNFPERLRDSASGFWIEETGLWQIGSQAFENCTGLTVADIPDCVEQIGDRAFANCYALKDVTMPYAVFRDSDSSDSSMGPVFAFDNVERPRQWENVTIGYGVASVNDFGNCPNLRTVMLPSSVRSIGENAFKNCAKLESVTIADDLSRSWDPWNPFGDEWRIGEGAFRGCGSLVHVDIPVGVSSIGNWAFAGCAKLMDVELPDSVMWIGTEAFYGCAKLTSVNLPDSVWIEGFNEPFGGVRFIGYGAFDHCIGLTGVDIPDCVEEIGAYAFGNCYGLKDVVLPKRVFDHGLWEVFPNDDPYYQEQGYRRAWESVTVGEGVEYIGECMFEGGLSLRTVALPRSVRGIGVRAFKDCAKLESVTISQGAGWHGEYDSSIASIGDSAFENCGKLTSVTIPDGVLEIGESAFKFSGLASVTIPDSVTRIGNAAFEGCGLKSVTIPDSVTEIGSGAFCICGRLESMTLPVSVTAIGLDAFMDCFALKSVILPKCVEDVGVQEIFGFGDSGHPYVWESVTLLDGWTAVGDNLFAGLQNLKSVTLPASVRTIGAGAFSGCVGLRDMTFGGNAPSAIGPGAFSDISPDCTAWVKKGSTGWGAEIAGRWQGMKIDYQPSSLYLPSLSYGANVVATQTDRGWTVASANGSALKPSVLTSLKVNVTLPDGSEVDTTMGYEKALSSDGKSVELSLKTPQIAVTAQERAAEIDEDDPSKMLVDVPESWLATKPEAGDGESVGALPVKAVKGLWYQVSWGDGLQNMTQGDKVQATSEKLYLGVIKQTGASGFYRLLVSEK